MIEQSDDEPAQDILDREQRARDFKESIQAKVQVKNWKKKMKARKENINGLLDDESLSDLFKNKETKIMFGKRKNFKIPDKDQNIGYLKSCEQNTHEILLTLDEFKGKDLIDLTLSVIKSDKKEIQENDNNLKGQKN